MFENTLKSFLFAQFEGLEFYGPSIPWWITPYRVSNMSPLTLIFSHNLIVVLASISIQVFNLECNQ